METSETAPPRATARGAGMAHSTSDRRDFFLDVSREIGQSAIEMAQNAAADQLILGAIGVVALGIWLFGIVTGDAPPSRDI